MALDEMIPLNRRADPPALRRDIPDSSFQMLATAVDLLRKSIATMEAAVGDLGAPTERPSPTAGVRGPGRPPAPPAGDDVAVRAEVPDGRRPPPPQQRHAQRDTPGSAALTARQLEVLRLLAGGMSNRQIARTLGITEKTVKNHMQAIFARLAVSDRTQAALYAVRHRLAA